MAREARQLYREQLLQRFNDPDLKDFVQSTLNILSDGIDIDDHHGLKLESKGTSKKLVSFYEKIREKSPVWQVSFSTNDPNKEGLHITEQDQTRLFIQKGGAVGIGTAAPAFKLQVEGLVASHGRVGTFASGTVKADGKWHTVIGGLDGCQAFEAFAHINDGNDRRFAMTFGILMVTDNKGFKTKIKSVDAASRWLWGRIWNKIKFRWVEDNNPDQPGSKYRLEIRSRTRYGMPNGGVPDIYYRIAKLWDKNYEFSEGGYSAPEAVKFKHRPQQQIAAPKPTISRPQNQSSSGLKIKPKR